MREFLLHSRTGFTCGSFRCLADGGRLDIVYQCILTALFKAQAHRNDCVFHASLNGPPNPPVHMSVEGALLRDVRVDERSWEQVLRNVLNGRAHPGISIDKKPFQRIIEDAHGTGTEIFVLSRDGTPVSDVSLPSNALFVVGDHIGLPKKDEGFALRHGTSISLGRSRYLAATCVDILNYTIDMAEGGVRDADG